MYNYCIVETDSDRRVTNVYGPMSYGKALVVQRHLYAAGSDPDSETHGCYYSIYDLIED